MLVFIFFPLPFLFQVLKNFTWPHSSCDFVVCGLIKYNGFQISRIKRDETSYLILKHKLETTNYMITTSPLTWPCEFWYLFEYLWKQWVWKTCIFLKVIYVLVCSKNIFRLLRNCAKAICKHKWSSDSRHTKCLNLTEAREA